jgi:hypothetical protein
MGKIFDPLLPPCQIANEDFKNLKRHGVLQKKNKVYASRISETSAPLLAAFAHMNGK